MSRKSIKRPKAFAGEQIAAAGIQATATLAGAIMQTAAAKRAAKDQAAAMKDSAKVQSESIKDQTRASNIAMKEQQTFIQQQNEQQREADKMLQQNMLRQLGMQQTNDLQQQGMIQVRNGGHKSIKQAPLRGSFNTNFIVTDGGGVKYQGLTPEGYELYEVKGDTHNERHSLKNGKTATGVGFKFSDGGVIEAEGAPKGKTGELALATPDSVYFISRHNLKGFNPVQAVKNGMHPLQAYNIQENIKQLYGIDNDDNTAEYGGMTYLSDPSLAENGILSTSDNTLINSMNRQNTLTARNGCRKKASLGDYFNTLSSSQQNNISAGITSVANLLGMGIGMIGNKKQTRYLKNANNKASDIMSNAYRSLKGIDPGIINPNDYQANHAIAATRAAHVNVNDQLTGIERNSNILRNSIKRNSISSAAMLNKLASSNINEADMKSRVYAYKDNAEEQIQQHNLNTINQTSQFNAAQDNAARQQYVGAKLDIAKYNNSIENQKILGIGQSEANRYSLNGQYNANRALNNANLASNALMASAQGFTNSFMQNAQNAENLRIARMSAKPESQKYADNQYNAQMEEARYRWANDRMNPRNWFKRRKKGINMNPVGNIIEIDNTYYE